MRRRRTRKTNDVSLIPGNIASLLSITAMTLLWLWINDTYLHINTGNVNKWQWWVAPMITTAATITTVTGFITGIIAQHIFGQHALGECGHKGHQDPAAAITIAKSEEKVS